MRKQTVVTKKKKPGELGSRKPLTFPDRKDAYLQKLVNLGLL
jgi:hypothetical protein